MKISIALATFNGGAYLQTQLDSLQRQTKLPDELVVCDDGSFDSTLQVLREFQATAPFPVAIHRNEATLGCVRNFERALSLCSGDVIFLCDQDDAWSPNKIAEMTAILQQDQTLQVLICDMTIADERLDPTPHTQLQNVLASGFSADRYAYGCATALRAPWLQFALPLMSTKIGHDVWLHHLARLLDVRLVHPVPLQLYRRHGLNLSNSPTSSKSRLGMVTALARYLVSDSTAFLETELDVARSTQVRLDTHRGVIEALGLDTKYRRAAELAAAETAALDARIAVLRSRGLQRLLLLHGLWTSGGYRHFSGWKSALKDLLGRPGTAAPTT